MAHRNLATRLFGTITVSQIVMARLGVSRGQLCRECFLRLLHEWPEQDRADLLWFLKSEGVQIPGTTQTPSYAGDK